MGNRDKLLVGARQCLAEHGYTKTTARDITAAAGVSLAAIGYHFGTVDTLLNEALKVAVEEWGEELEARLAADGLPATGPQRFRRLWDEIIASIETSKPLWVAQLEMVARAEYSDDLRTSLTGALTAARTGLARTFFGFDEDPDDKEAWLLGSMCQALLLGSVVQRLFDPERALAGDDLSHAVALLATRLTNA